MSGNWEVFQRDVLDVLGQYQGFFDHFERIGSLGDDSRPDCFARVSRSDKKEVWVVDAKNKTEISGEDRQRMDRYIEMLSSNPIDVGLELSELSDYRFRGIFVTPERSGASEGFESVGFKDLHQFLQRELVYTDTDRVVRDVAKMVERKQLSQSQARLLFRSLKPFEERVNIAMDRLEELETRFVGLELEKPPFSSYEHDLPVDAVMRHSERDGVFLFDIPYSPDAVKQVDEKVEEVKKSVDQDEEVYYAAVDTFDCHESRYVYSEDELEQQLKQVAGIVSPEEVVELFNPKIPTEKEYGDSYVEVRDNVGLGYRARVSTTDDVNYLAEAVMPREAMEKLKDTMLNSSEIGETEANGFRQRIEVTPELSVCYAGREERLEGYRDTMENIFLGSINPVLGRKVSRKA